MRGQATEIVDVGHFLPLAYDDWFRARSVQVAPIARARCCWSTTSAFFRNMLTPVLKAAGYEVTAVPSAQEALTLLKNGQRFDVLVTDLDMPDMDGFALAEAVREEPRFAEHADHRAVRRQLARSRSSAAARSVSTTTSPSSTARA